MTMRAASPTMFSALFLAGDVNSAWQSRLCPVLDERLAQHP